MKLLKLNACVLAVKVTHEPGGRDMCFDLERQGRRTL